MRKENLSLVSHTAEATVFVDTSLGTHIAVTIDPNDTVSALKRKIEHEHLLCFTSAGKIEVEALKVKRKGLFYHLSDSMVVRNAFRVNNNWFVSADAKDVPGKRLSNFNDSMPLLLEGNKRAEEKVNIADQAGSVDSARETSKQLEIGFKSSGIDHCATSFDETANRLEPEIQEDHSLCSEGYRVPKTQDCREDGSRKEIDVQCDVSSEKALPDEKKRQRKTKQRNEKPVQLKEDGASVLGFGKEQSQPDIIPPENSLGNQSRDVLCDVTIGKKTTTSKDVSQDMAAGNKNTAEEPCRSSASSMVNRSHSGIHMTNDAYKDTEVLGKHIGSRENTSKRGSLVVSNIAVEDASQSQPAANKKRKLENISGLEDSLKENDKVTSKPEIASEFSLRDTQKNASAILYGSTAESSGLLTNSSRKKKKKREISPNSLHEVVAAAPSGRDVLQERSDVAASGSNDKNSGVEDNAAPINEQGRKDSELVTSEKTQLPGQDKRDRNDTKVIVKSEWLDANGMVTPNTTSKKKKKTRKTKGSIGETSVESGAGHIKGSENGIWLDEPQEAVHGEHASDKAKEEESNVSKKNGIDVSEKETESSHIVAKTDNLDRSEVGNLEQNGKPQENAESMEQNVKKKSKRKKSTMTKEIPNLKAEAQKVGHQVPTPTTDMLDKTSPIEQSNGKAVESDKGYGMETDSVPARSKSKRIDPTKAPSHALEHTSISFGNPPENGCSNEADKNMEVSCEGNKDNFDNHQAPGLGQHEVATYKEVHAEVTRTNRADDKPKKKRRKLDVQSGPSPDLQSSLKGYGMETDKGYGMETDSVPARSKSKRIDPTKAPSHALEHTSISFGNPPENGCSNEADKNMEVSCEGNKDNFDNHQAPGLGQHEVATYKEVHAEVTRTNRADDKPKKKRRKLDVQSGPSPDLQSSLKSKENQGIDGRSEAGNSNSIQPQGSSSKGDDGKRFSKKVPKTGTKAPTPDKSDKMNSISKAARNHSGANVSGIDTRIGKKNDSSAVLNSKLEKANNKPHQNKMDNKSQSGVNRNRVASRKPYGIDYGEVVNSPEKRKILATPRKIFKDDDSSGSSEDEGKDELSKATTQTPSDYSSSGYSDGESNADMSTPRSGKAGGRSVIKSCTSGIKDMNWDELAKSSSTFKKAKLTASQSQLEEDSEPIESVPDSQKYHSH